MRRSIRQAAILVFIGIQFIALSGCEISSVNFDKANDDVPTYKEPRARLVVFGQQTASCSVMRLQLDPLIDGLAPGRM